MNLPEADANDFGARTGSALQSLGESLGHTTERLGVIKRITDSHTADKWTNDSMTQLRDYYSKWVADSANNSKESFADEFKQLAETSLKDYEAKAPNNQARDQFRQQFQSFASSHYAAAANTSARTQVENLALSHENANDSLVNAYQSNRSTKGMDANQMLVASIPERFASIEKTFGTTSPSLAKKLKNQLVEDSAYAVMNYSPATARKILSMGNLDGRRIHSIESQIRTAEQAVGLADHSALMKMGENRIKAAAAGKNQEEFRLTDINYLLPDDKANVLLNDWNTRIKTFNTINDEVARISPWSGPEQIKRLQSMKDEAGKNIDTAAFDLDVVAGVERHVADNIAHFQKDPAGYTLKNNPALKAMNEHIAMLSQREPGNQEIPTLMAKRDTLLLSLQSPASGEYTADERRQHYTVNRAQLKVMSDSEAQQHVQYINESSPQEALKRIQSVIAQHPGNEGIAFNNLVQLENGKGIRGDYWLLYKNQHNVAAADLVGALQWSKEAKNINPELANEVNKALDGYGPWKQWLQSFPSDNYQQEGMLGGMRDGVISYALMQAQVGKSSIELALKKSVDTWIYSEQAIMPVNGQSLVVDRNMKDGQPKMTDSEVNQLGYKLGRLPELLDPRQIDRKDEYGRDHFPFLNEPGNEMTQWEQLRNHIVSNGFFKPAGDYATLYMRNQTGTPFEVRSQGKAVAVKLTDVPSFLEYHSPIFMGQGWTPSGWKNTPSNVKPLTEKSSKTTYEFNLETFRATGGMSAFDPMTETTISTNWPVTPKYIYKK